MNREVAFSFDRLTLSRGLNEERREGGEKKEKKFIRIYTPVNNTTRDSSRERGLCFSCDWITSVATWLHPRFTPSESLSLSLPSWPCNVWNVRPTSLRRERSLAKLSVEKFSRRLRVHVTSWLLFHSFYITRYNNRYLPILKIILFTFV